MLDYRRHFCLLDLSLTGDLMRDVINLAFVHPEPGIIIPSVVFSVRPRKTLSVGSTFPSSSAKINRSTHASSDRKRGSLTCASRSPLDSFGQLLGYILAKGSVFPLRWVHEIDINLILLDGALILGNNM